MNPLHQPDQKASAPNIIMGNRGGSSSNSAYNAGWYEEPPLFLYLSVFSTCTPEKPLFNNRNILAAESKTVFPDVFAVKSSLNELFIICSGVNLLSGPPGSVYVCPMPRIIQLSFARRRARFSWWIAEANHRCNLRQAPVGDRLKFQGSLL